MENLSQEEIYNNTLVSEIHKLVDIAVKIPYRIKRKPVEQSAKDLSTALETVRDFLDDIVSGAK